METLLLSLGLEEATPLWPWFVRAACQCLNTTATETRDGKSPHFLRQQMLGNTDKYAAPDFGFNDPVFFKDAREKTTKENDK